MSGELRVCYVLATSTGGVGRHVLTLVRGLTTGDARYDGTRVAVLGPTVTEDAFDFVAAGATFAPVEISDRPRPVADLAAIRRLRRLLGGRHGGRPEVVHAHGLRAAALTALALMALPTRPPLVVTLHNAPVTGGRVAVVHALLERLVARRADRVLGVSPDLVERMGVRGARAVGPAVVPAPALPAPARTVAEVRAELDAGHRPILLTVARLAPQKGLGTLLDAARGWAERTVPPLVVVAGDGPLHGELQARVASEDLPVRLLGARDDVADLLGAADVVVVPSVWEGQPLIVQEALRAARPIVASRTGGVPDLVDGAAVLVPSGDAAALQRAVTGVLDRDGRARRLAAAAAARGRTLPGPQAAVAHVREVYADVLRGAGRSPRGVVER